jgi:hypothetical protein
VIRPGSFALALTLNRLSEPADLRTLLYIVQTIWVLQLKPVLLADRRTALLSIRPRNTRTRVITITVHLHPEGWPDYKDIVPYVTSGFSGFRQKNFGGRCGMGDARIDGGNSLLH